MILLDSCYFSFDAGTQSVKVAVYNQHMECLAKVSHPTTLQYPSPGWVEMNADEYLQLTLQGMRECMSILKKKNILPEQIKAIMGDGIICGIVGIDSSGQAITPYINYLDSRTQADVERLKGEHHTIFGEETGNADPSCMFPAMHARWLLRNHPEFQQKGRKFVHNAPYILMHLAGLSSDDAFVDWGTMSGWGLGYHIYEKTWSEKQLQILGISQQLLPKIVKPWDIVGTLTETLAKEIGCPAGIPVCAGAGDTMQSMLGSGIYDAGKAVDVAGTCAMFCVAADKIIPALSREGSGLIFNSGTLENTYFYWGFVRTGGLALRWFKDNICRQETDNYYQMLSEKASLTVPGCHGVLFLPYLTGGYDTYADVKGAFLNMTLDTDQFVLWRSVLEAIAYDYKNVTDAYRQAGILIEQITVTEGGSRDDLWNQIKADVLEAKLQTLEVSGGAVLTNAAIAAYAAGDISDLKKILSGNMQIRQQYQPDPVRTKIYHEQAVRQKKFLKNLHPDSE